MEDEEKKEKFIQQFYSELVDKLPMDDAGFRGKLYTADLLPGNLKQYIKTLPTSTEKAEYFLDEGIKNDFKSFQNLVTVMERCKHKRVKELAEQINRVIQPHQSSVSKSDGEWITLERLLY